MKTLPLLTLICLSSALLLFTGCPDPDSNNEDVDMTDMADVEMDMTITCEAGFMVCDGKCTQIDENNCGSCGRSCGRGALCNIDEGTCGCLNGGTWCGVGQCLATLNDSRNCGGCGVQCPAAHYCVEGSCEEAGELAEVVKLTNEARAISRTCGDQMMGAVPPLQVNKLLTISAQAHAEDMAERKFFAHDAPPPNASTAGERIRAAGYMGRGSGENIARGQRTPKEVVDAWIDSPGHCVNIMRASFDEIGIGYVKNGNYWVQNFGSK